jgi:hypothetical protein
MGQVSKLVRVLLVATSRGSCRLFSMGLCLTIVLGAFTQIRAAHGDDTDHSLRVYAVNILRHPKEPWTGYGIYLGNGLVLSAAHVVGWSLFTRPSVLIAGLDLPATAIKEGSLRDVDLTLLSVDQKKLPISLQMRRLSICVAPPWPGEPVIVAIPESTARSHIMSPLLLPRDIRAKFGTVISDVATTGNSGSGVFDANRKCLLGIMSRKFQIPVRDGQHGELKDLAKYFVPASAIRAFIPVENRF